MVDQFFFELAFTDCAGPTEEVKVVRLFFFSQLLSEVGHSLRLLPDDTENAVIQRLLPLAELIAWNSNDGKAPSFAFILKLSGFAGFVFWLNAVDAQARRHAIVKTVVEIGFIVVAQSRLCFE